MGTFDLILIIGGVCGLLMVVGGMLLLYKGAISLQAASERDGLTLELKRTLKLTTQYPALGLFVIGLAFIGLALSYSRPSAVTPLRITGTLRTSDPSSVTVYIGSEQWLLRPTSDGSLNGIIYPNYELLTVEIAAPGRQVPKVTRSISRQDFKFGIASLGEVPIGDVMVERPKIDPDKIKDAQVALPPLSEPGKFN